MDENSWKGLLAVALAMLDDLAARGFGAPDLALGGGTVLMMRLKHRLSKDIDIFLHDAQWLTLLTPRLNDQVGAIARDYAEQANSLKLVLDGGDIDFIVAGSVTGALANEWLEFSGRKIALESTEEILAKKLYFRAGLLKPRDVFDLVAAHRMAPAAAAGAIAAAAPRRAEQLRRLKALEAQPPAELERDIAWFGDYGTLLPTMIMTATTLIEIAP